MREARKVCEFARTEPARQPTPEDDSAMRARHRLFAFHFLLPLLFSFHLVRFGQLRTDDGEDAVTLVLFDAALFIDAEEVRKRAMWPEAVMVSERYVMLRAPRRFALLRLHDIAWRQPTKSHHAEGAYVGAGGGHAVLPALDKLMYATVLGSVRKCGVQREGAVERQASVTRVEVAQTFVAQRARAILAGVFEVDEPAQGSKCDGPRVCIDDVEVEVVAWIGKRTATRSATVRIR